MDAYIRLACAGGISDRSPETLRNQARPRKDQAARPCMIWLERDRLTFCRWRREQLIGTYARCQRAAPFPADWQPQENGKA